MPIHFAGSRRPARSVIARCLSRPAWVHAGNDNGDEAGAPMVDTPLLRATLEHFAQHGLAAAGVAFDAAEAAGRGGDSAGQHHWMTVCRMLDRRLPERRRR